MVRLQVLLRRAAFPALVSLALLGCASDDPLEFETTQQAESAGAETSDTPDAGADPGEAAEPGVFPPVNEDVSPPSADKIVDLTGNETVEIEIRDNVFDERFFRVDPGTQIVFVNRGANPHNVLPAAEGAFPTIEQDALADGPQALILDAPGDYPFYCAIHGTPTRGQTGYVIVGGA